MSNYSEEAVAAASEALGKIRRTPKTAENKPVKYVFCPICKTKLTKILRLKRTWECKKCGFHISPNLRKIK